MAGLLRLMSREMRDIVRGGNWAHAHLRQRIVAILLVTLVVDAIGSTLVYLFEHDASGTQTRTVGDCVFWTTCQLLTVSSQLRNPVSTGGKLTDVFLELYAIVVVATLAGSWGAFFHQRSRQRQTGER
jgi:hypothetical protein